MADEKLDFPTKTEAFHDPADGMYKMRDSEPASVDGSKMVQLESGIFAPAPKWKAHRVLWIVVDGGIGSIEADEPMSVIQDIISHAQSEDAQQWYYLTDPSYGFQTAVPRTALQHVMFINTQFKDIEAIEAQQKDYEMQKRLAALQRASKDNSTSRLEQIKRDFKRN